MSDTMARLLDVQVRQPCRACLAYVWDKERGALRATELMTGDASLPADLAMFLVEQQEIPVLLITTQSCPSGTWIQARLLGAFMLAETNVQRTREFPLDGCMLVMVSAAEPAFTAYTSFTILSAQCLSALRLYCIDRGSRTAQLQEWSVEMTERVLREARVYLKRQKRQQLSKTVHDRRGEEYPVAWRAIEGLDASIRLQIQHNPDLQHRPDAPHAQSAYLIRFVPQRFQEALKQLLLDDERLLAFVERPLLQQHSGWFGSRHKHMTEGLLLVTDQQILWLRDFSTPSKTLIEGGYIAQSFPLEHVQHCLFVPAGERVEADIPLIPAQSIYHRMLFEISSQCGCEHIAFEFPTQPTYQQALASITVLLAAFQSYPSSCEDRRLRQLPMVEAWMPGGDDRQRLAGLGGIVPVAQHQLLEQALNETINVTQEEVLVSTVMPALEDFHSPPRLMALTRTALLIFEYPQNFSPKIAIQTQRYALQTLSSVQLCYSLFGSSLSITRPQMAVSPYTLVIPFHSPAIAWFLPLFIRLRMLLRLV